MIYLARYGWLFIEVHTRNMEYKSQNVVKDPFVYSTVNYNFGLILSVCLLLVGNFLSMLIYSNQL